MVSLTLMLLCALSLLNVHGMLTAPERSVHPRAESHRRPVPLIYYILPSLPPSLIELHLARRARGVLTGQTRSNVAPRV